MADTYGINIYNASGNLKFSLTDALFRVTYSGAIAEPGFSEFPLSYSLYPDNTWYFVPVSERNLIPLTDVVPIIIPITTSELHVPYAIRGVYQNAETSQFSSFTTESVMVEYGYTDPVYGTQYTYYEDISSPSYLFLMVMS